jgi:hypothetical protein
MSFIATMDSSADARSELKSPIFLANSWKSVAERESYPVSDTIRNTWICRYRVGASIFPCRTGLFLGLGVSETRGES